MDDVFRGKRVTIAGLGHFGGGIAVSRWLAQQGARVLVTDRDPPDKLIESVRQLDSLPITFRLGQHRIEDFTDTDLVVTSPAIPPTNEFLQAAREAGVPITTEIRLFIEHCPSRVIGVTGTKGKSTTTKLLSLMLESRYEVWTGGNIGGSLLFVLPEMSKDDLVVLELSSYMLEYLGQMRWSPHVALVNMIGLDHQQWHGSAEAYVDAKRDVVRFQEAGDTAVVSDENEASAEFASHTKAAVVRYGVRGRRPFQLAIPGQHNQLNARAAFAAAGVFGITWDDAQRTIADFAGLPHRLQLVHTSDGGVRWYNDSIATIPDAAVAALESFPAGHVIQIVGGSDKQLDLTRMCAALSSRAKAVLTIGATGPVVAEGMRRHGAQPVECATLDAAVRTARDLAGIGDIVLLSPGFASYDQFTNFEQRGEQFVQLVNSLA